MRTNKVTTIYIKGTVNARKTRYPTGHRPKRETPEMRTKPGERPNELGHRPHRNTMATPIRDTRNGNQQKRRAWAQPAYKKNQKGINSTREQIKWAPPESKNICESNGHRPEAKNNNGHRPDEKQTRKKGTARTRQHTKPQKAAFETEGHRPHSKIQTSIETKGHRPHGKEQEHIARKRDPEHRKATHRRAAHQWQYLKDLPRGIFGSAQIIAPCMRGERKTQTEQSDRRPVATNRLQRG